MAGRREWSKTSFRRPRQANRSLRSLLVLYIQLFRDTKHQDGTATPSASFDPREQLAQMCCRCPVRWPFVQGIEEVLEFVSPSDDDADANGAKIKKQPKVIQVPVVEWILVIPFYFECHPIAETVYFVRWRVEASFVYYDPR